MTIGATTSATTNERSLLTLLFVELEGALVFWGQFTRRQFRGLGTELYRRPGSTWVGRVTWPRQLGHAFIIVQSGCLGKDGWSQLQQRTRRGNPKPLHVIGCLSCTLIQLSMT